MIPFPALRGFRQLQSTTVIVDMHAEHQGYIDLRLTT